VFEPTALNVNTKWGLDYIDVLSITSYDTDITKYLFLTIFYLNNRKQNIFYMYLMVITATACSTNCDTLQWMIQRPLLTKTKRPITFHYSINQQHLVPILRMWPPIIHVSLVFVRLYICLVMQAVMKSEQKVWQVNKEDRMSSDKLNG